MNAIEVLVEKKTKQGNNVVASIRGRPRDDLKLKKPQEIFRSLGIRGASDRDTALASIADLIMKARREAVFKASFGKPRGVEDDAGRKGVLIPAGDIDTKTMTQYLALFIIAAFDGGFISKLEDIRVQDVTGGQGVIIYQSNNGRPRWKGRAKVNREQSDEEG